jgi:hypothetical protein
LNRAELQRLAEERALDAKALLDANRWSGAYYLAGYAVECGLKACVARLTNQHDFPDKQAAIDSYSHEIEKLVRLSGLKTGRDVDVSANPPRNFNWSIVKDWRETSRYQVSSEPKARELFAAVTDPTNGVLPWIKDHW